MGELATSRGRPAGYQRVIALAPREIASLAWRALMEMLPRSRPAPAAEFEAARLLWQPYDVCAAEWKEREAR